MSLPATPPDTAAMLIDCRLLLLAVVEDVAGVATLLREACEIMEEGERGVSQAQSCAAEASDAASDAIKKLRAIALKCEEFAQ